MNKIYNFKSYKHYELLEELTTKSEPALNTYLAKNSGAHIEARDEYIKKLNMDMNEAKGWFFLPLLRNQKRTSYSEAMPELTDFILKIPGLVNCTVNLFEPGAGAGFHSDYEYDMRPDLVNNSKCLVALISIFQPSQNIKECGFQLGNKKIPLDSKSIIVFDGSVIHGSWNHTKLPRYTMNLDILSDFFCLQE